LYLGSILFIQTTILTMNNTIKILRWLPRAICI